MTTVKTHSPWPKIRSVRATLVEIFLPLNHGFLFAVGYANSSQDNASFQSLKEPSTHHAVPLTKRPVVDSSGHTSCIFRGKIMVEVSIVGPGGVHRAAEELIAEYGSEALDVAKKRTVALRSEGFESLAKTWDLICAAIENLDGSRQSPEAYNQALNRNVFLSE